MNVATMLAELKGAAKFVDAQRAAGDTAADLEDNMSDGLSDKISRLRNLTTEQGATLTSAVTAGPWPAPQREKLAKAIRTAVYDNHRAKGCRENQEAMVELFFRQSDWDAIMDKTGTMSCKLIKIRKFLANMDLILPHERLIARMANLLRQKGSEDPDGWSADEWKKHLDRVKKSLEPNKKSLSDIFIHRIHSRHRN